MAEVLPAWGTAVSRRVALWHVQSGLVVAGCGEGGVVALRRCGVDDKNVGYAAFDAESSGFERANVSVDDKGADAAAVESV